ncbi:MAG: tetratricopeptide repeat protein, partial [Pseudomonadales bacterium]
MNNTEATITQELIKLADFYGVNDDSFMQTLNQLNLEDYTEIILGEQSFELVIGGIAKEQQLLNLAVLMAFPTEIVDAFKAFSLQFPNKMLYTKLCFGQDKRAPSMYFCCIEPWEQIVGFLQTLPSIRDATDMLNKAVADSQICFLLGFTLDKNNRSLVVKTYHLLDRQKNTTATQPTLLSYRLSEGKLEDEHKHYTVGVAWETFAINDRWRAIVQRVKTTFSEEYASMMSELFRNSNRAGIKLYIFRADRRESENTFYSLKDYNYYTDEGVRLSQLNHYPQAIRSFTNAINYNPEDARAHYCLGTCHLKMGHYVEGISCVLRAEELCPQVTTQVLGQFVDTSHNSKQIAAIAEQIDKNPSADLYNNRGLLYFQNRDYDKAQQDFSKAIELDTSLVRAYTNAGAACMKLGLFDEALDYSNRAAVLSPGLASSDLALTREVVRLSQCIDKEPAAQHYNDRGLLLYQVGLFNEAQDNFINAAEMGTDNSSI